MEVDTSSTTGSRNPSPSLPEGAQTFANGKSEEQKNTDSKSPPLSTAAAQVGATSLAPLCNGTATGENEAKESVSSQPGETSCPVATENGVEENGLSNQGSQENTPVNNHEEAVPQEKNISNAVSDAIGGSLASETLSVSSKVGGEFCEGVTGGSHEGSVVGDCCEVSVADGSREGSVASGSCEGSVASESREGSVVSGSHEGSVVSGSCEGSVASGSCEGSVASGSREGSVVSGSREGSVVSGSREGSVAVDSLVTEAMLKEEQRLLEKESQDAKKKVPTEVEDLRKEEEQKRYSRLLHLLQRSTVYSKFLVKRMETQAEEDKKKEEKKGKRKKSNKTTTSPVTPGRVTRSSAAGTSQSPSATQPQESGKKKRGRKRKASPGSFKISDFMDSQGKLKKRKMDNEEGESPVKPQPKEAAKREPTPDKTQRYFEGQAISPRQPKLLTGGVMRSYQLDGMDWIKLLYENGVNGILGDEMGLGKTIQCISVIAYMIERGVTGPFLIAAPLSTVPNWVAEFKRFTPKIPVVLYHGSMAEREELRKTLFLTQAEIAQRQANRKKKRQQGKKSQPSNSGLLQHVQSVVVTSYEICMRDVKFLQFKQWRYLVVDEGHRIKNLNCKLIKTLKSYDAANRLLLTGTPLQNNLAELWSLLNFLLPDIFDDLNSFQSWFDFDNAGDDEVREKIIAQEREQHVLRTLHQILTPFLLRRLKTDVEYTLPPKKEVLVYAPLTEFQEKYYKSLLDKSILDLLEKERNERLGVEDEDMDYEGGEERRARRRKSTNKQDYTDLTDSQFDSIMTGEAELEDFITAKEVDTDKAQNPKTHVSALNIKMTSVYTMLRLCSNHPYLLEFPLTPDGQFRVDEELIQCCGKTRMLDRLLTALIKQGHKTLVFSQFTKMLDILEDYLELRGIAYSRLDGSMQFADRQINITKFKSDPKCMVFLLSTRAAGLGLNLTAADTVIIYDSDWNPQADLQAQDRCHRIGQSNPVMVYRLVTANTIDQRIVERAASKRTLEKMIIHKGKFKGDKDDGELSLDDLSELLHTVDHDKVVRGDGEVISDKDLEALLDRSVRKHSTVSKASGAVSVCHSGVFKVLEEIGNVVCNKGDTKDQSKEGNDSGDSTVKNNGSVTSAESQKNDSMECGDSEAAPMDKWNKSHEPETEMECEMSTSSVQNNKCSEEDMASGLTDTEKMETNGVDPVPSQDTALDAVDQLNVQ